jgi:hypothetical protein
MHDTGPISPQRCNVRNRLQERGAAFDGDRPGRSHHGVELKKFERRRAELMG